MRRFESTRRGYDREVEIRRRPGPWRPRELSLSRERVSMTAVPPSAKASAMDARQHLPAPDATFSSVYQDHWSAVRALAGRALGRHDAHDVAQDVFLRLWSNPERFDEDRGSMRAYLVTMTRSAAIDRLRADNARRAREDRHDAVTQANESPGDHIDGAAVAERVRRALARLTAGEADAIIAAYFGEHTYQDVATMLGVPEGTVKSRIRSGLKKLQVELKDLRA